MQKVVQNVYREDQVNDPVVVHCDDFGSKDRIELCSNGLAGSSFNEYVIRNLVEVMRWDVKGNDDSWLKFWVFGFWCEDFFLRLGWAIGESLKIEDETVHREKLDRGRALVLIPFGVCCPKVIKVVTRRFSFPVYILEDPFSVNSSWISSSLGLGLGDSTYSALVGVHCIKRDSISKNGRVEQSNFLLEKRSLDDVADSRWKNKDIRFNNSRKSGGLSGSANGDQVKKQNNPRVHSVGDGNLLLKKEESSRSDSDLGSDDYNSFLSEDNVMARLQHGPKYVGESSKANMGHMMGGNLVIDLSGG
ncbi:hypothetical protein QYF36_003129 [Acer negundo]|nr:hypothetical protein QYF36_003129 [Acer negundo]